jgi:nitroreductase
MSFLENLNWRYAAKKFDINKKVSEENLQKIRDAIRMTPTSFGAEMFSVVEVTDLDIRNKIKEVAWGQSQITDGDRVFVFCARNDAEARIENMFTTMSGGNEEIRKTVLAEYEAMVRGSILSRSADEIMNWSARQAYIALGFALAAAAELKVDSCPMEGFDPKAVKDILGLGDEFLPVVMLPVGYRDENDEHLKNPKFRFPESEIISKK